MPSLPHSLPRICVALGLPTVSGLSRAAESEYKDGNTFLEFRLDYLDAPSAAFDLIREFCLKYPDAFILATCRAKACGGYFEGPSAAQLAILQSAAEAGAAAIDLEIEIAELAKSGVAALRQKAVLVISYHNFETTPALDPVLRRLRKLPADVYKIVLTARKPNDNLRLIRFLKDHSGATPLVAFCMSETGLPTRILSPSLGAVYTYAAPCQDGVTAPGQIPARLMRSLFRCEKLTRHSKVYGVIADPVSHTRSPLIHNRAFQARRIDAVYLPFLVPPSRLAEWMGVAVELGICGFSVTIPHKQSILRHLDIVEPLAKRIGAVNTVWRKRGKWRGTNTDADGVLQPLSRCLRLPHASVLVVGSGGAARAAAIALADAGANVTVTGRDLKRIQALARSARGAAMTLEEARASRYDALVHATPVGMYPHTNDCLFPGAIPAGIVLDMVYNPQETQLVTRALEQNCTVIYGSEMLLEQAARQFEIWTGESAPRGVMQTAFG